MPKMRKKKNNYEMKSGVETFCREINCSHRNHCGTQCSPNNVMCCFLCTDEHCSEEDRKEKGKRERFILAYEKWLKERNGNKISDNEGLSGKQKTPTRSSSRGRGPIISIPLSTVLGTTETYSNPTTSDWVTYRPIASSNFPI